MEKSLRVYMEVLRLVRRLPKDSRAYYAKYARENFVNYRDVDARDSTSLNELFHRAYNHSIWVLNKYSVEESAAKKLKEVYIHIECFGPGSSALYLYHATGEILRICKDEGTRAN